MNCLRPSSDMNQITKNKSGRPLSKQSPAYTWPTVARYENNRSPRRGLENIRESKHIRALTVGRSFSISNPSPGPMWTTWLKLCGSDMSWLRRSGFLINSLHNDRREVMIYCEDLDIGITFGGSTSRRLNAVGSLPAKCIVNFILNC